MADLEFTGERVVPGKSPADLVEEHRARYEFAMGFVREMNVIDIGCGSGYGSAMLGTVSKRVVGIDISEDAIRSAKENYASGNVEFRTGDVINMEFGDNEFDAGVCFEVIEHIENPVKMLEEAGRIITDGGIFIASTPNGVVKVSSQRNPYHVREYSLDQFRTMLEDCFKPDKWNIEIFGQFIKGKTYARFGVAMKNIFLTMKGAMGVKPKSKSVNTEKSLVSYEFRNEHAELAEYLIAVVKGRK